MTTTAYIEVHDVDDTTGGTVGASFSLMNPYIVVYMFKRTA
jgi:hypothetical protein